ncbi:hypothetical protein [Paracoccus sp. AK26]|uniref:hypothetical protein n=1 Tax=Paracoccus sp. AK26 TaxID=2589076 RepID=UPI0014284E0D|nr:hypothetical protein [Paracoccus sp. AK26]QIR85103.1 hypothetical protein FIU66_07700 [Paracoccus sp. AK26]
MNAVLPKYRLERDDLVRIANVPYRPISPSASGYLMVRNDLPGGLTEEITHEELAKFVRRGDLQHERGHFAPAQEANRPRSPEAMMRGASAEDLEQARLRECYV